MTGSPRLAVLGSGWAAERHVSAAAEIGAVVVGVSSNRLERAQQFAGDHGIPRATANWRDLVDDDGVDVVVVATPNGFHAEQACVALAAGKQVLVEKPIATTVADGRRMIAAAEAADRRLMVAHMLRFRPEVQAMRERVASGELGQVVRSHGYALHLDWGPQNGGWFVDRTLAGGGALIDLGVHAIDTMRFVLGDPRALRVAASMRSVQGEERGYDVEDDALLLIEWDDGGRAVVECGWWQMHRNGIQGDTEVYGTRGHARIWSADADGGWAHVAQPQYTAQLAHFLERCRDGGAFLAPAEEGVATLDVVERAYRAAGL